MKTLIFSTLVSLVTLINAAPGGVHDGTVISGPSGVVTNHGAIGPAALGLGGLGYGGHGAGAYIAGPAASSAYVAGSAAPAAYVAGPSAPAAFIAGPAVSHASVIGPAAGFGGHGLGLGFGGFGGFGGLGGFSGYGGHGSGLGLSHGVTVTNGGGTIGLGHHGVTVKGPATVPATIAGPAGKVVADGLYGVPSHGHGW